MNNGKNKILAILLLAISLVSLSLFGISCKKQQESIDSGVTTDATYYCQTEEEDYFVTLTGAKTYILSIAGEQKAGEYFLSESGELKLTVDSVEVLGSINNDELAITYGGTSYTLLEKVKRSVTFNDNGATTIISVTNGKAVAKPEDPMDTDGEKFVGWYTSAEFKEVYNFATPVRKDITVYAQHVKLFAGVKEFTVTLKDGSDEEISTINGVVYGLEDLASKDGKEFDGWYVSDFNDESKLTYKYSGETLKQNVNLYPVWKSEISAVTVNESKISWEAEGSSFEVKITDSDNVSETKRVTQNYLDYTFKNAGEYKIEISKTGSDNLTAVYYNSKALARVSNIAVVEGGVVSYNTVENAEKYIVTVECGNANHKHTNVDNGKRAYFDISGCDMKEGGIKVVIVAEAKGYATSQSEAFYYDKTLDKVAVVEVKDGKLVWSEVKNALGYVVVVNGEEVELGNVNEYSLKSYDAGDYELEVYPVTKGYNSPEAAVTTYKKVKLASPAGVAVNGNILKWDSVAGATAYTIKLNGKTFTSEKNEVELKAEDIKSDNTVTITAIGDGVQSEESDMFTFAQGKMSELTYVDGKVEWEGIFGAKAYVIKLNGNFLDTVAGDITSYKVAYKIAGENKVTVGFANEADATEAIDESSITVMVYTVSFAGEDGESLGSVLVAEGDPIDAPVVKKAGFVFAGWYKVPNGSKNNAQKYTSGKLETAGDVNFYADFDTAKYKVTLNADASVDKQIEETVEFRQYFTLSTIESEDDNLSFGGWYTEPGGQGKQITDSLGNGIGKWIYAYDGVELYANWVQLFNFKYNEQGFIVTGAEGLQYVTSAKVPVSHYDGQHNAKVVTVDELEYGENLVSIDIPDTVTTIQTGAKLGVESSAFKACTSLKAINIYKTGETTTSGYVSYDGILYEAVYTRDSEGNDKLSSLNLLLVPYAKEGDIVVAEGTSGIATYAFASTSASTVTLPESVTDVKDYAFSSMSKLTEVTFLGSDANKQVTFGEGVFASDTKLTKITLPAGLVASTHHVVEWDNGYEDKTAGNGGKSVLYEYDIDFDTYLFNKDTKLQSIEVNGNGGYYKSVDGMLCKADGTIVYCPKGREKDVVTTNEITAIGNGAFKDCNDIKSVTINAGVTYIGFEAFYCTYSGGYLVNKLTDLTFTTDENDNELTIDGRAFYNQKITSLTLPANLVKLGKYAFGNTSYLTEVTVESIGKNGVLDFEDDVFATKRTDNYLPDYYVETVTICENVPAIGVSAVFGPSLKNVTINSDNYVLTDKIYYSKDGKQVVYAGSTVSGEVELEDGVEIITANVFANAVNLTSINIPASVKVIGDGAFRNSGLKTIVFETSETSASSLDIGQQAFYKSQLSGIIEFPERLTSIGEAAFKQLSNITEFKFDGTKLTTIGARAFEMCYGITAITFNEGLTTIGKEAFYACTNLTTINLPSSISEIGSNVVASCSKLETISVGEGCVDYSTNQGVLYKNKKYTNEQGEEVYVSSELVLCPAANAGASGKLTIPKTVTVVNDGAFSNNKGITEIEFEDYDEEYMNTNELLLGSGSSSTNSIFGYSSIKKIKLPRGLVTIKAYSLTSSISGSVKFEEIIIPNTVKTIESYSMCNLTKLTTLTFEEGNDDLPLEIADGTSSYNSAFGGCTALATVNLPARTTKIGAYAFYSQSKNNNDKFTTITIPANVQEIGNYAFANRCKLKSVTIVDTSDTPSQLTKIGQNVFYADAALTSITLPSSLEEIGYNAFATSGLTSITIPASVRTIGMSAFEKCTSLVSVKFEETQKSLEIGTKAFNGCTKLATLELAEGLTTIGDNAFTSSKITEVTIPSTVTMIGAQAFKDSSLSSVTFASDDNNKSSLKSIAKEAFGGTDLTTFEFPETVGTLALGDNLFKGCMSLTKVTVSLSVKALGNALGGASEIKEVVLFDDGYLKFENGMITNGKDAIYIVLGEPTLENGTLVIPEGVTSIGDNVFEGYTDIKTVILPSTIMSIGKNVFANCTSLEKVVFTDGAPSLLEISGRAFENCISLKSIDLPINLETISYYAFANSGLESIKIPATVATLGGIEINEYGYSVDNGNSFDSCKSLKSVTFAKNGDLKVIYKSTFNNCTSLESVTLPDGLEEIGTKAFANTKLKSVNIGAVVTTIGNSAFSDVTSLTELTFTNNGSINTIDASAFANTGLTSVELPATLTTLGASVFKNCADLKSVIFKGQLVTTINASTFAGTGLTSITIPDSVTLIKDSAFQNCTELTEVNLSSRLEILGTISSYTSTADKGYVFDGCSSLESITLPESLTYIGTYTFSGTGLKSITIPSGVVNLAVKNNDLSKLINKFKFGSSKEGGAIDTASLAGQFANCTELEEVILPITLQSIGAGVFYNTPKLSVVKYDGGEDNVLPSSVTAIGGYAFANSGLASLKADGLTEAYANSFIMSSFTSVDISKSPITTIRKYAFYNTETLTTVKLPETLTTIEDSAFEGSGIQNPIMPDTVVTIGKAAFKNSGLKSITLRNVTNFSTSVFEDCGDLTQVTLSNELQSLPASMFKNCSSLTSLTIPDSVVSIGADCLLGTGITSLTLPAKLASLGVGALSSSSLTSVTISDENKLYKVDGDFLETSTGKIVAYIGSETEVTLPESASDLSEGVFAGNTTITKITVPATISTLTTNMFYNCLGVKEIVISDGVTKIEKDAFSGCVSLEKLVIPSSVTTISANAFRYAGEPSAESKLTIDLSQVSEKTLQTGKMFEDSYVGYIKLPDTMSNTPTYFFRNAYYLKEVNLPEGITELKNQLFYGCKTLQSVSIPASVTKISATGIFNGCYSLTSVTFLGDGLTVIPGSTFYSCYSLTDITLPAKLKTIEANAFSGTTVYPGAAFTEITIPETVTTIGNYAFRYCYNLKKVNIEGSNVKVADSTFRDCTALEDIDLTKVSSIGQYAFSNTKLTNVKLNATTYGKYAFSDNSLLTTVEFAEGKATLGDYMFSKCTALTKVVLPSELTAVPNYLFNGCTNLVDVKVPETVTTVGNYAFSDCSSLTEISLSDKVTSIGSYAFQNCTSVKSIYIPKSETNFGSANSVFSGWTSSQTINFEFEGYKVFKLYGSNWMKNSTAKVNFGVTR